MKSKQQWDHLFNEKSLEKVMKFPERRAHPRSTHKDALLIGLVSSLNYYYWRWAVANKGDTNTPSNQKKSER